MAKDKRQHPNVLNQNKTTDRSLEAGLFNHSKHKSTKEFGQMKKRRKR